MIPPLDEWDVEEDARNQSGCGLSVALGLAFWALMIAAVKAFWPG